MTPEILAILQAVQVQLTRIETTTNEHTKQLDLFRSELSPLKGFVSAWGGVSKALATLVGAVGVVAAVWKLAHG